MQSDWNHQSVWLCQIFRLLRARNRISKRLVSHSLNKSVTTLMERKDTGVNMMANLLLRTNKERDLDAMKLKECVVVLLTQLRILTKSLELKWRSAFLWVLLSTLINQIGTLDQFNGYLIVLILPKKLSLAQLLF